MKFIHSVFVMMSFSLAACSNDSQTFDSKLASHVTQNWTVSPTSEPMSMLAESGPCAENLPTSGFSAEYCFNSVPALSVNVVGSGGSMTAFCVATHLPGMSSDAALLVVDAQGQFVSEVTGQGTKQLIDSFARPGRYTVYVGFPTSAPSQRATVRMAPLAKFALSSPACSFR